jgi:hypothetical protein
MQKNCGACDTKCRENSVCSAGTCVCPTDFGDCNNDLEDGCEVDLLTADVGNAICTDAFREWQADSLVLRVYVLHVPSGQLRRVWQRLRPQLGVLGWQVRVHDRLRRLQ